MRTLSRVMYPAHAALAQRSGHLRDTGALWCVPGKPSLQLTQSAYKYRLVRPPRRKLASGGLGVCPLPCACSLFFDDGLAFDGLVSGARRCVHRPPNVLILMAHPSQARCRNAG